MIDLHERLSEFSYGYGVTREVEQLLSGVGIRTAPFMPSLLQEKQLAFDVSFSGRGVPLLLQFKLGHSLKRFVRSDKSYPAPLLDRPFFRFSINTAEPDGQFETLLKAETDGAEAYYVAPRFTDWPQYVSFFENGEVLNSSVMIAPGEIRTKLAAKSMPDGRHRIVYDQISTIVCSTPTDISEVRPDALAETIRIRLKSEAVNLGQTVHRMYAGLDDRAAIRRKPTTDDIESDEEYTAKAIPTLDRRSPRQTTQRDRIRRLTQLRERARSGDDALAAALGLEFWGLGIQLLFAVESE